MTMRRISSCPLTCGPGGFVLLAALIAATPATAAASLSDFIRADGRHLADGDGRRFAVKGINLGNWLVPEGYMFKFKQALAPKEIEDVVENLVGAEQAARF